MNDWNLVRVILDNDPDLIVEFPYDLAIGATYMMGMMDKELFNVLMNLLTEKYGNKVMADISFKDMVN